MLSVLLRFLRNWALPLAMLAGAAGYPVFIHLSFLTPWLIFTMLLLTFCKVPFSDLHFKPVHLWLLLVQIGGAVLVYLSLRPFNVFAAEGAFICVIAPTATAAAVITDKLGGSAASLTSYTLLGNIGTAIAAPLLFPLIHPLGQNIGFFTSFLIILKKVFPLLICPFVTAMIIRRYLPKLHAKMTSYHEAAFYLWAVALIVVMAQTVNTLINEPEDGMTEIWIALAAMVVCCLQFFIASESVPVIRNASAVASRWDKRTPSSRSGWHTCTLRPYPPSVPVPMSSGKTLSIHGNSGNSVKTKKRDKLFKKKPDICILQIFPVANVLFCHMVFVVRQFLSKTDSHVVCMKFFFCPS